MSAVLFEPAAAIAASHCLTARLVDLKKATTQAHPRRCAWCDWPIDELRRMVNGFNAWAGFDEKTGRYEQHDARAFQALPPRDQRQLVLDAQGLEDEVVSAPAAEPNPPPADPPSAPPAADPPEPEEDDLSWLG